MLSPPRIAHPKHYILQTSSLPRRPMQPRRPFTGWNVPHIQHKIPDLSPEHGRRSPSKFPPRLVLIPINQPESLYAWCCFKHGKAVGVADQLCVIEVDYRGGDLVGARGEVDDCGGGGRGCAAGTA